MKNLLMGTGLVLLTLLSCAGTLKDTTSPTKLMNNNSVQLVHKANAQLGEGALWNHKTQELYWIDIIGKQLHIMDPANKTEKLFSTPSQIGTVVPTKDGNALVALEDGIYKIDTYTKEIIPFSKIPEQSKGTRFNDGKCDPAGRLWVGTLDLNLKDPIGHLYMVEKNGSATQKLQNITISNGIVWSNDDKTMYYIDTPTQTIKAYDYDIKTGHISNERIAVKVEASLGHPDGMTIDEEGMLWVGMWNGGVVIRFNPNTGKMISKIDVPALNVTSCAFGGKKLDTLYITTARIATSDEMLEKYPNAGSVFKVVPGVRGVKNNFFGK